MIVETEKDTSPSAELYPVQLHFYRHAPSQRHPIFSLSSLGLNHLPFHSQSNLSNNYQQPSLPSPPKRSLMYYGSFSRRNTVKQVSFLTMSLVRLLLLSFTVKHMQFCIELCCFLFYCIVLHCFELYCVVLYCFELYCMYCSIFRCIAYYCIELFCIVLYGIVLYHRAIFINLFNHSTLSLVLTEHNCF